MEKIELKAYGKINLGLDVIRKRPDGYHDLDMIMQMVDVYDDIVITKNKTGKTVLIYILTSVFQLPGEWQGEAQTAQQH